MTEGRLKRQEGRSEEQDEQYTAPDNVGRGMPTWSKSVSIKGKTVSGRADSFS